MDAQSCVYARECDAIIIIIILLLVYAIVNNNVFGRFYPRNANSETESVGRRLLSVCIIPSIKN